MSFKEFLDHIKSEGQVIKNAPIAFFSFVAIAGFAVFLGVDWHYSGTISEKDATIAQKDETIRTVSEERDSINRTVTELRNFNAGRPLTGSPAILMGLHDQTNIIVLTNFLTLTTSFVQGIQGFAGNVRNHFRHHLAFALHHAKHNRFVRRAAPASAVCAPADIRFINFNITEKRELAVNKFHVISDQIRHAPRRLVSHAKLALQLLSRNTVPRSGEKVNGIEPKLQRCAAIFKRRSDCRMKMMATPLASVSAFGFESKPVGFLGALRADVALSKADGEQMFQTRFISRELRKKFADGQTGLRFFFGWRSFHAPNIRPNQYLCQGDNSVWECALKERPEFCIARIRRPWH